MPISADPDKTAEYVLPTDADKPADTRPTFICRFMTRREYARVNDLANQAFATPNTPEGDAECYRMLREAIAIGVVGWRNMAGRDGAPVPFALDNLDAILSDVELWTLVRNYPSAVRMSEVDAKKPASPSPSTGELSVTDAPADSA